MKSELMERFGDITIYHGDCLDILPTLPEKSVDVILCDPPYGIDYQSAWRIDKSSRKPKIANDKKPFTKPIAMLSRLLKDTGCCYIFTRWDVQQVFIDEMNAHNLPVRSVIVWDKGCHSMGDLYKSYGSQYESIIFSSKENFRFPSGRPVDIIKAARVPAEQLCHPNEKPSLLLQKIIIQSVKRGGGNFRLLYGQWQHDVGGIRLRMRWDRHRDRRCLLRPC
jgi:DNA modification methylase